MPRTVAGWLLRLQRVLNSGRRERKRGRPGRQWCMGKMARGVGAGARDRASGRRFPRIGTRMQSWTTDQHGYDTRVSAVTSTAAKRCEAPDGRACGRASVAAHEVASCSSIAHGCAELSEACGTSEVCGVS
jgi:hypothetical protein